MIYTCTLNPSVDYIVGVPALQQGNTQTSTFSHKQAGGKGINVSRILRKYKTPTTALGFLGGFTGDFVSTVLTDEGIRHQFTPIDEDTRINIKIKAEEETELNGASPYVSSIHWETFLNSLSLLQDGDSLVLAGSVPTSLPTEAYQLIAEHVSSRKISLVVDARGDVLRSILPYDPFLVKPNHHELGELFDVEITGLADAKTYGMKLVKQGAQHVIVSLAGDGALLLSSTHCIHATVPTGKVVNSVGAGDSLVGGFLATYTETKDIEKSFRYGVATGSATAFSLGLAEKDMIEELLPQVKLTYI